MTPKKLSALTLLTLATAMITTPTDAPAQVFKGATGDLTNIHIEFPDAQKIMLTVTSEGDLVDVAAMLVQDTRPTDFVVDLFLQLAIKQIDFDSDGKRDLILKDKAEDIQLSMIHMATISPLLAQIVAVLIEPEVPTQTDEDFAGKIKHLVKQTRSMIADAQLGVSTDAVVQNPVDA